MFSLFDNPALLLVGFALPLLGAALGLFALYWVVRLAVRHGVGDASRRAPGGASGTPGGPGV